MRISDDRYLRDFRRLELARRMLALQARTRTVERWTGLPMNRIRALYHTYLVVATPTRVPRRGVTPFRVGFFWKSSQAQCDGAILASFLRHFAVWPQGSEEAAPGHMPDLSRGERFCHAVEEFHALRPRSELTLEHAATLLMELIRGEDIELTKCPDCVGLMLRDRISIGRILCPFCAFERNNGLPWRTARQKRQNQSEPESENRTNSEEGQGGPF